MKEASIAYLSYKQDMLYGKLVTQKKGESRSGKKTHENAQTIKPRPVSQAESATFHIVGIGASAGGLEALTSLFEAMPENNGSGFVIVSHLAPKHVSLLPEILQRLQV